MKFSVSKVIINDEEINDESSGEENNSDNREKKNDNHDADVMREDYFRGYSAFQYGVISLLVMAIAINHH